MPIPDPDPLPRSLLAYENPEFLDSADGRMLRILAEYAEPLARFRRENIQDTVVFFGSARFAGEAAETARRTAPEMARFYNEARQLAFLLTEWSQTLTSTHHRFVVTSGGGPGIMEAANRGAYEAGGKSIGLNIRLPFEQAPNRWITPALSIDFHYFFMRKYWFAYLAKALVVFPGGFGTLDELFEVLTLAQTGKLAKNITVILYGSAYWKTVLNFEALAVSGAIAAKDLDLFAYADTPESAFAALKLGLTRYHLDKAHHPEEPEEGATLADETDLRPEIARTRG
jgi:uncharacterized protein (TIGR00730 family)